MSEEATNAVASPPNETGPCGSGKDHCIHPWAKTDPSLACMRCRTALHPLCAAIDATRAPERQRLWPLPIRICYQCLLPGEQPNNFGLFTVPIPEAAAAPTNMVPEMQPPFTQANVVAPATAPVPTDPVDPADPADPAKKASSAATVSPTSNDAPKLSVPQEDKPAALPEADTPKQTQQRSDEASAREAAFLANGDFDWAEMAKPHSKFVSLVAQNKVIPPPSSKKAVWWRVFHFWNMDLYGEAVDRQEAYCNLCGEIVRLDPHNTSPSPLQKHLKTVHKPIHAKLLEVREAEEGPSTRPTPQRTPVEHRAQAKGDFDWAALAKPHQSFLSLATENKVIPPPSSKQAVWWRVFHCWNMDQFGEAVDRPKAYCNLCGTVALLDASTPSPTPLRQHLKTAHNPVFKELLKIKEAQEAPPLRPYAKSTTQDHSTPARHDAPPSPTRRSSQRTPVQPPSPPRSNVQQPDINRNPPAREPGVAATGTHLKAITQWILETNQPLDVVESSSFGDMTAALMGGQHGGLELSKKDIGDYLSYLKTEMQKKFKKSFVDQKLVHVHDQWVDYNSKHHWSERIRWIDNDFKLQERVIASDSGSPIVDGDLRLLLASLGINAKYQVPVTVSSTAESTDSQRMVVGELVLPSLDITLNRFAKIALEAMGEKMKTAIEKARVLTHKIHNSKEMSELLLKVQSDMSSLFLPDHEQLPIVINTVPDMWWSIDEMIGRLLQLRKALDAMLMDPRGHDELDEHSLNQNDWDLLTMMDEVWRPFQIASLLLQKQSLVTVSMIPLILQAIWEDLDPDDFEDEAKQAISKTQEAWDTAFGKDFPASPFKGLAKEVWVAHAVDPRYKDLQVLDSQKEFDKIHEALLEVMVSSEVQRSQEENSEPKQKKIKIEEAALDRGLQRLSKRFSESGGSRSRHSDATNKESRKIRERCKAEFRLFQGTQGLQMWIEKEDGSKGLDDPLAWWAANYESFPILWRLAQMYLPIPAVSSTPSRAFDSMVYEQVVQSSRYEGASSANTMKLLKENATWIREFKERPSLPSETSS